MIARSRERRHLRSVFASEAPTDFAAATRALRRGEMVVDRVFDEVFPSSVRPVSSLHWTPVAVAMRVAMFLAARPTPTILDVGAGVGKFCLVAAATLPRAHVIGVEQRSHFVTIARDAASKMGVDAEFTHGTIDDIDAASVDGIYLFNPFAENVARVEDHIDETVELSREKFLRDLESTERFLHRARVGTRVVTYWGWGGDMPPEYRLTRRETRAGALELWVKSERTVAPPTFRAPSDATMLRAVGEQRVLCNAATATERE